MTRIILFVAMLLAVSSAHATVITFDDLTDGQAVPSPYGGIVTWVDFTVAATPGTPSA